MNDKHPVFGTETDELDKLRRDLIADLCELFDVPYSILGLPEVTS